MNRKIIFAATGGVLIGSGVTLLLTRRYYLKVIKYLCDTNDSISEELRSAEELNASLVSAAQNTGRKPAVEDTPYDEVLKKVEKTASFLKPSLEELARQAQYELEVEDTFYISDEDDEYDPDEDNFEEDGGLVNILEKYADFEPERTTSNDKYLITEDEYGELENYETIELVQYADGLIADKRDNLLDDIEDTLGVDNVEDCGDRDIYWIRDDNRRIDYEIMRLDERYIERMHTSPFRMSQDIYAKNL